MQLSELKTGDLFRFKEKGALYEKLNNSKEGEFRYQKVNGGISHRPNDTTVFPLTTKA